MMKPLHVIVLASVLALLPQTNGATTPTIAADQINLNGHNLRCDSFNSTDTNRSTNGKYDPAKAGDGAYVGLNYGIVNSSSVGNASIWGLLDTQFPFVVDIGAQGSIGSSAWHLGGFTGIEPGYHTTNYNLVWPDVPAPFPGILPVGGTIDGVAYTYILSLGDYDLDKLVLSGNDKVLVTSTARLHVRGEVKLSGNASIRIRPGAGLQMYVGGASANIGGNGIINEAGFRGFVYVGLANNTSLTFKASAVNAVFYAPRTALTITSPGNVVADIEGSMIVKSVSLEAGLNLHFDEALNQ